MSRRTRDRLRRLRSDHFLQVAGLEAILLGSLLAIHSVRADVTGTVTLKGPPNSRDETFVATAAGCGGGSLRHTENWKIGPKGELADVVVWIVNPKFAPTAPPAPETVVKQIGCRYEPHVIAVKAGALFKVINGDPALHNIRARAYLGPGKPPGENIFNFGQSYQGQTDERRLDQPGIYMLQCDVHSWMQCWVMVLGEACFGATGPDGTFVLQISGQLLDGDYKIDAWHPRFAQPLEQTVSVKKGAAAVNFQFDGTKSF
jgi:plastocyanin